LWSQRYTLHNIRPCAAVAAECIALARLHARLKQQQIQLQAAEAALCQAGANTWQSSSAEQYCSATAKVDGQQGVAVYEALQELMGQTGKRAPLAVTPDTLTAGGGVAASAAAASQRQPPQQQRLQCQVELADWEASEHAGGLSVHATVRPVLSMAVHTPSASEQLDCTPSQQQQGPLGATHLQAPPRTWQGPEVRVCYAQLLLVAPGGSPVVASSSWSWDAAQGVLQVQAMVGPEQLQLLLLQGGQPLGGVGWSEGPQRQQQEQQQQQEEERTEGIAGPLLQVARSMHKAAAAAADGVQCGRGSRNNCSGWQLQAVLVLSARCDAIAAAASCYRATSGGPAPAGMGPHSDSSLSSSRLSCAQALLTPTTVMVCLGDVPWTPHQPQQRLQALLQGAAGAGGPLHAAKAAVAASTPQKPPVHSGVPAAAAAAAAIAGQQPDMWAVPPTPDSMQIEDVVVADTPDADAYDGRGAGHIAGAAACHPFEPLQPAGVQVAALQAATTTTSSSGSKVCTCPSRARTPPAVMELLLEGNPRHLQLLPRLLVDSGFQHTACASCNTPPAPPAVAGAAQQQQLCGLAVTGTSAAAAAAAVTSRSVAGVVLVHGGAPGQRGEVRLQRLPSGRYLEVQLTAVDHAALLQLQVALGAVLQVMQVGAPLPSNCGGRQCMVEWKDACTLLSCVCVPVYSMDAVVCIREPNCSTHVDP
jgi:hypothetical protein